MKMIPSLIAAISAALLTLPAQAQFAKPEDAIHYRKASMNVLATHFFRLATMVNGRVPYDPKVAIANADIVMKMSKLPWPAFAPGTDQGDTRSRPSVWTQPAKFKDLSDKMVTQVAALDAAAKTGDLDKLKVAFRATAGTCQSCHDVFRSN
jgi:cytochrome c556